MNISWHRRRWWNPPREPFQGGDTGSNPVGTTNRGHQVNGHVSGLMGSTSGWAPTFIVRSAGLRSNSQKRRTTAFPGQGTLLRGPGLGMFAQVHTAAHALKAERQWYGRLPRGECGGFCVTYSALRWREGLHPHGDELISLARRRHRDSPWFPERSTDVRVRERRPEFWRDAHYKMRALVPSGRRLVDTQHQVVRRDQIELGPAVRTDYPKPQAAEAYRRIMRIAMGCVHELG